MMTYATCVKTAMLWLYLSYQSSDNIRDKYIYKKKIKNHNYLCLSNVTIKKETSYDIPLNLFYTQDEFHYQYLLYNNPKVISSILKLHNSTHLFTSVMPWQTTEKWKGI